MTTSFRIARWTAKSTPPRLYKQLVGRGYYCRFKIPPRRKPKSEGWDLLGRRALLKSRVLIVVGTKGALASPTVLREARRFHRRRKQIVPISFDGTLERSLPRKGLLEFIPSKLLRINATAAELTTGPAPGATERLSRIFDVSRQSTMRGRLALVLGVLFAILAAITGYQWWLTASRFQQAKQDRYVSDMALVQSRWDAGDWSAVIPILERHHPQSDRDSERGFEWSYRWLKMRMSSPTLQVHSGEIQDLTCGPDGALLVAASRSGLLSVRSTASGKLISDLENPSGAIVNAVAFSPDGHLVAGVGDDKQLRLWDPLTGKPVKNWQLDKPSPSTVAFVNDGKSIMVETTKGVAIWEIETGQRSASIDLQENNEPVTGPMVFCDDGRYIARLKKDHAVDLIVTKTKKSTESTPARGDAPYMVEFSPDGTLFATQAEDQTIHVRDVTSGIEQTSHDKPIAPASTPYGMAFDLYNRFLAAGCDDGSIKVWNFRTGDLMADFKASSVRIYSVTFSRDGGRVIGGSLNGEVRAFMLGAADPDLIVPTGESGAAAAKDNDVAMAFSPDGMALATCAGGDSVRVLGIADGQERNRFETGQGSILAMKFSDDGRRLGTLGNASSFNWWDLSNTKPTLAETRLVNVGEVPVAITADGEWVVALTYSAEAEEPHWVLRRIAISGAERVFATDIAADIGPGVVHQVAASPSGALFAAAIGNRHGSGALVLGEVISGKVRWLKQYPDETPKGVAFSPDSKFVVAQSNLGHVWVYDVATGSEQLALQSSRPTEDRSALGEVR